jgi:hypothetical protein
MSFWLALLRVKAKRRLRPCIKCTLIFQKPLKLWIHKSQREEREVEEFLPTEQS